MSKTKNQNEFTKRAYGFAVVKSYCANYNADFSGQPRTLPSGKIYATDKALKYTVRNFLKDNYTDEKVFFFKRMNEKNNPISLDEAYQHVFGGFKEKGSVVDKISILQNLTSCIDVRLFGATFAGKTNVSIHGTTQVNHGINIWTKGMSFSEQISSPFSNKSDDPDAERGNTTLGRQSRLEEGHYVHHFSVNPKNLADVEEAQRLSESDIVLLKEALCKGATYYDSASKAGVENEILFFVTLKEGSTLVLPNFTDLIRMKEDESEGSKRIFDLSAASKELNKHRKEIESCEIYYNQDMIVVENIPEGCQVSELN